MPDLSNTEQVALRELLAELTPFMLRAFAAQISGDLQLEVATVGPVPIQEILAFSDPVLATVFSLNMPVTTESVFYLSEETARVCMDILEGNDGRNPSSLLSDEQTQQLSNVMLALGRSIASGLASNLRDAIEIETCTTHHGPLTLPPAFALDDNAIQVEFALSIGDIHHSSLTFLLTPALVRGLLPTEAETGASPNPAGDILNEDELAAMLKDIGGMASPSASAVPSSAPSAGDAFPTFPSASIDPILPRGMELILDIPLDVTVELGRVRMLIKDVLELSSGSIVELDRVAGEPVDLLVNGRLIAKGEVVVIEDNFGIRITEVVSPADRVAGLGKGR